MLEPAFTGPFKKDRKLVNKRNKDMDKLYEVMFYRTGSHSDLY